MAAIVAVVALLPYAWGPVYHFPPAAPFTGSQLWNPYASRAGSWQRANLHAHGQAWGGLTNGEQPDADVATRYRSLGYSVAGVSNYMSIAADHGIDTIPLYEHGVNLSKSHQLAVGAHSVDWFDFPLWQTRSNQQYVINRVHAKADLVALNHPSSRNAYDLTAMRSLTGYNLVEVANGPFTAEDVWDAALSSGHPVWAVANDDTHDLNDARRVGVGWNQIDAPSNATKDIVAALAAGRFYAVLRTGSLEGSGITTLQSLTVADGTMTVNLSGVPSTITFIGTDGAVRQVAHDTLTAAYAGAHRRLRAHGSDDTADDPVFESGAALEWFEPARSGGDDERAAHLAAASRRLRRTGGVGGRIYPQAAGVAAPLQVRLAGTA